MTWWVRPLIRMLAAVSLPLFVPLAITLALWALPGDPASIICPPGTCDGVETLTERWNLGNGPFYFYWEWLKSAATLDFGNSWTMMAGVPVYEELVASVPTTLALVLTALLPLLAGTILTAMGWMPRTLDYVWQVIGITPAVILALCAAAYVEITYGVTFDDWGPYLTRIGLGALVLALSDGALAGAVGGTRALIESEYKQRYMQVSIMRGETQLGNALPNVLPTLIGQLRGRVLHVLSGAVVVEVVVGIPGLGDLLWSGTLEQDFGVVLAAAFAFSAFSGTLMMFQAIAEIGVALYVRRSPAGVREAT